MNHWRFYQQGLHCWGFMACCLLFLGLSVSHAATESQSEATDNTAVTYGELMLIEKEENPSPGWQLELSGMREFSNPYLDIAGASFSVRKAIGSFVYVGPEYTRYSTSESDTSKEVAEQLQSETIRQQVYHPRGSLYGVVSVVPISGHLNWFNANSLPFELSFTLGYGAVQYDDKEDEGALVWRTGPRAFFSKNFGLQMEFGQEIESVFSGNSITRSQARIGLISRF